jgi:hypothetical protein
VNVYLAHLLHSFINPEYVEQSKRFLSKYDTDVFRRLANSSDSRLKYLIYKTNADFLLISIGIFATRPRARGRKTRYEGHRRGLRGRAKAYYQFAYSASQAMFKATAISKRLMPRALSSTSRSGATCAENIILSGCRRATYIT